MLSQWLLRLAAGVYKAAWLIPVSVVAIVFPFLTLLVTYSVFMRYVVGKPVYGPNEISGYLLLATAFLGLAYTQKERAHIKVDVITERLSLRVRMILDLITTVLGLIYTGVFIWQSWLMTWKSFTFGWKTLTNLATPFWIPQIIIPIGAATLTITLIATLVQTSRDLHDVTRKR